MLYNALTSKKMLKISKSTDTAFIKMPGKNDAFRVDTTVFGNDECGPYAFAPPLMTHIFRKS